MSDGTVSQTEEIQRTITLLLLFFFLLLCVVVVVVVVVDSDIPQFPRARESNFPF